MMSYYWYHLGITILNVNNNEIFSYTNYFIGGVFLKYKYIFILM